MFGQSIPVASPVGAFAGFVSGECAGWVAKRLGASPNAQQWAVKVTHAAASSLVGWAINAAAGADITGAAVHTGVAAVGAEIHGGLHQPEVFQAFEQ
ncbi:hypothetical protein [Actinophytocola sp.]|uniref:hypothetical protein n=1 Tax=Actinophytocola sp. TaxID=1872138 RepID=UPI002ED5CA9A